MENKKPEGYVIIDFAHKGSVIRFTLGRWTPEWGWFNPDHVDPPGTGVKREFIDHYYGDDWDDIPYECNAGEVYDEFVYGHIDLAVPYGWKVIEPCAGECSSRWCKDDMADRKVPCLLLVPEQLINNDNRYDEDFSSWIGVDGVIRVYFGDPAEAVEALSRALGSNADKGPVLY